MSGKPLKDITILDLSRLIPGPFCSLILSDLGARVTKVEDPHTGDYLGAISPAMYQAFNRGKKRIVVDLKSDEGQVEFVRLVKKADVLIESFRPGVMSRLGLSLARLKKMNPRLIVASITGFGQKGPNKDRAGHDLNYMSLAGLLDAPRPPSTQYADLVGGGLWGAMTIMSALYQRTKTKKGVHLDISMTDSMIFLNMGNLVMNQLWKNPPQPPLFQRGGVSSPPLWRRGERGDLLSGMLARYRIYQSSDGKPVALAALEEKFWSRFCDLIDRTDLKEKGANYGDAAPEIHRELEKIFVSKTWDEWARIGEENDICLTPVLLPEEVLKSAQFREKKNFVKRGKLIMARTPLC